MPLLHYVFDVGLICIFRVISPSQPLFVPQCSFVLASVCMRVVAVDQFLPRVPYIFRGSFTVHDFLLLCIDYLSDVLVLCIVVFLFAVHFLLFAWPNMCRLIIKCKICYMVLAINRLCMAIGILVSESCLAEPLVLCRSSFSKFGV